MRTKIIPILGLLIHCAQDTKNDFLFHWIDNGGYPAAYFSYPGRFTPVGKKRNVKDAILRLIEETRFSLYLHIYSFDDPEIEDAILSAVKRGVRLEIMGEFGKTYPSSFSKYLRYWKGTGLQHTKVLVSDGRLVFIGTGNFTYYGLERDNNGYVLFTLRESEQEKFHSFLREEYPFPKLFLQDMEFWNSPNNGRIIQHVLTESVRKATRQTKFLIFDHYDPVLSLEFSLFNKRGGEIEGIYDRPVDPEGIQLSALNGVRILEDGNEDRLDDPSFGKGGLLHHKTMVVDSSTLLTGSFNYSVSARDTNREILMRTSNPYLVREFEFEHLRIQKIANSLQMFYGNPENSEIFLNGDRSGFCRTDSGEREFLLDIGDSWMRWKLYYKFGIAETCKNINNFEIASMRLFGGKFEFPAEAASFFPFFLSDRFGNKLTSSAGSENGREFLSILGKPLLFLRPEAFLPNESAWIWKSTDNKILESLSSSRYANSVWVISRGKLPFKSKLISNDNLFRTSDSLPTGSGAVLIDYGEFSVLFCFKSETSKLSWTEELMDAAYEVTRPIPFPENNRRIVEDTDRSFFSIPGLPHRRRDRLCVIGM
ncbi:PLD-like domain protein [Leptospira fainei serovar Hurstbridge str. BUT 6]|uniref:phospholipase D n=1 Tax=Leptospira fainei serovar Hurstbridge str. BUT 6 TaxID=1193011 RepID=S3V4Q0_9LEPT|nr:phospholipase D-like domain-containing protein [Leptospira fainei]EPG75564.1 PLD-like domain protein [Leptospira fainei serovar Hurstbridge str. BUT 6]